MSNVQVQLGGQSVQVQVQSSGFARANAAVTLAAASAAAASDDADAAAASAAAAAATLAGAALKANNLSDLASASTARTNLGLGSIATQAASNVAITGGSIAGIVDLALADGGTGASTASVARDNLGLTIGANVQAYSANLDEYAAVNPTAAGLALLDDADASAQRTTLAVVGTADLAASTGAALVGSIQTGTGAVARTAQAKLRDFSVNAADFGTLQQAIDAVNTAGGGRVLLNNGTIALGSTGLTIHGNVVLEGAVGRYGGSSTRGTTLTYSGTGAAIYGQNILDSQILNIDIDCSAATGTSVRGVHLSGVWKTTLRNVTVRGVTPAKGYGILFDTVGVGETEFGGQHNYIEQVECSDGIIRLQGVSGVDGVTTTVLNTVRGYQYQIVHSQGVAMNATAEGWATGPGYLFDGVGTNFTMVGCDIEGAGSPGIEITNDATVREIGTIWAGFSGTTKVSGAMASLRSYGGALEFSAALTANTARLLGTYSDASATYASDYLVPTNVSGGAQAGYIQRRRLIAGAEVICEEGDVTTTLKKTVTVATASKVTLMTLPVPGGQGFDIKAVATGNQPAGVGTGWYHASRTASVINDGTVLVVQQTQINAGPDTPALAFEASGSNLLVTWTGTAPNSTDVRLRVELLGDYNAYT